MPAGTRSVARRKAAAGGPCLSIAYGEVEPLLANIRAAGCVIEDLEIGKPDLEEVFIRVMQGNRQRRRR
jgi:hypothetical protein